MRFDTPRFGTIEVEGEKVIRFDRGLPGFPECARFIVMEHDRETPLKWLQCVDRPEVAFLVVEPEQVMASYSVDVPDSVLQSIQWRRGDHERDVAIFVILSVAGGELTANLRAPVVVNIRARLAFQMILDDLEIPLRHPIRPEEGR